MIIPSKSSFEFSQQIQQISVTCYEFYIGSNRYTNGTIIIIAPDIAEHVPTYYAALKHTGTTVCAGKFPMIT